MITIKEATHAHISNICEIEKEAFSDPWSQASILNEIANEQSIFLVATKEDNTVVGYVSMRNVVNEGYINNIAVSKQYRGLSIGTMLILALLNESDKIGIAALTLEVRVSNAVAIKLYEKFGFETKGYRKNFYSNPSEDAAIMWKI